MEVTKEARRLLAGAYKAEGLGNIADWISAGSADKSTHTPALRALTTATAEAEALRAELAAKDAIIHQQAANAATAAREVERLREALVQADLKIRSFPGADQSDVEFIRAALERPQP